ncbi:MAG: hypothetical protein F4X74_04090 [Acidimicrobiia bacterium]|nr:hypothetical protein [Acidimicrobiia bacterium]
MTATPDTRARSAKPPRTEGTRNERHDAYRSGTGRSGESDRVERGSAGKGLPARISRRAGRLPDHVRLGLHVRSGERLRSVRGPRGEDGRGERDPRSRGGRGDRLRADTPGRGLHRHEGRPVRRRRRLPLSESRSPQHLKLLPGVGIHKPVDG